MDGLVLYTDIVDSANGNVVVIGCIIYSSSDDQASNNL